MHELYDEIETRYRPDLRWWLAEGLNTDETLRKNVREISDSGFGAAEFLAMPEPGADSSIYGWGSQEWTNDTRLIIDEATKRDLGFSLTSGSHWANANLPDTYTWQGEPYTPDNKAAAKELDYATILLRPGERFQGILPLPVKVGSQKSGSQVEGDIHATAATYTTHQFQGVVAAKLIKSRAESGQDFGYAQGGGTGTLAFGTLTDLTDRVHEAGGEYRLDWTAPDNGDYALFAYWMHGTGQTASPSVSTNYTINYVDRYGVEALIDYWEEIVLTEDLKATIRRNGRGEIYMDSLELNTYGAGGVYWGYHIKEEFRRRMGYDITPFLPLITMNGVRVQSRAAKQYDYIAESDEHNATAGKLRADFYRVLSDMYVENVLEPLQRWLHSLNMTLRAEPSYGMPYEISTPARCIDGIETESFAQVADIDLFRGMSGAAHMYGRTFSSETGAVRGRNYYYNMDDWTQLCYLQFAEGVSRTVFHGYSAIEGSEADTYWPGHEGMYTFFSERFNSRQPASLHYPAWTRMLARNQKVLRQGVPARDIAILRTDYFFINYGQPAGYDTFATNYSMHDIPYYWQDLSLQRAGYTYDYFSPLLLEDEANISWTGRELQPHGPAYRALIVYQQGIELSAAKRLLAIVRDGLPLLFVNNNTEIVAHDGTVAAHKRAASVSKHLGDSDAALAKVIAELKALPNVREVEAPGDALAVLEQLGVRPRVAFEEANSKILTMSRRDEATKTFYTFAYSYKFDLSKNDNPYTFTMSLEGEGTPYQINDWTGEVREIGLYRVLNGRTHVTVTLRPGESRLIALDLGSPGEQHAVSTTSDAVFAHNGGLFAVAFASGQYETTLAGGQTVSTSIRVPKPFSLPTWDIVVEDWNEGEKVVNTEEKFGHVTTEVYYTTRKTRLEFPGSPLLPWKELPATDEQLAVLAGEKPSMAHVSGIGVYTASFTLPVDWSEENGALLCIDSAGGGTLEVQVNGKDAPGVNTRTLQLDISGLLKPGENSIRIEVASTLTNRMLQRRYHDKQSGWTEEFPTVQSYGLTGEVRIVPYTAVPLRQQ